MPNLVVSFELVGDLLESHGHLHLRQQVLAIASLHIEHRLAALGQRCSDLEVREPYPDQPCLGISSWVQLR